MSSDRGTEAAVGNLGTSLVRTATLGRTRGMFAFLRLPAGASTGWGLGIVTGVAVGVGPVCASALPTPEGGVRAVGGAVIGIGVGPALGVGLPPSVASAVGSGTVVTFGVLIGLGMVVKTGVPVGVREIGLLVRVASCIGAAGATVGP